MAVAKLTASKQAIQFIDDEGNVFQTSVLWITKLLNGENTYGVVTLTRLPMRASQDRFQKSPLLGAVQKDEYIRREDDAFNPQRRADVEQKKAYEDKQVF